VAVSPGFRDYVLEQLGASVRVTWRPMFGGVGLYGDGAFFGVVDDDVLFFRVDDETRPRYETKGSRPFAPMADEQPMRGYYEVPGDVIDDRELLAEWARGAVRVAREKGKKGKKGKKGRNAKNTKNTKRLKRRKRA